MTRQQQTERFLAEEVAGQKSFVAASDTLPAEMMPDGAREALEKAGVKFLGPVEGDPLFQQVELPPGWKKVPTRDARLSMLVDNRGRERARLFYKAASYDRSAALNLVSRYGIRERGQWSVEEYIGTVGPIVREVTDGGVVISSCGKTIHRVEVLPASDERLARYKANREAVSHASAWLFSRHPQWEDATAYWDD